jgi:DNA-binding LacI/PurR family transcriptional regulator
MPANRGLMKRKQRPTIAQVAQKAGVSPTTVSHALNGKGRVDEATKRRVVEAARRLGYFPNHVAQSLVLGRSNAIGLIYPKLGELTPQEILASDWYGRVTGLASEMAYENGQALTLLMNDGADQALRLGLDGVLILDPMEGDPSREILHRSGLPYVIIGGASKPPGQSRVFPDVASGIRLILDHLLESGATSIACLSADVPWPVVEEEEQAYLEWMREHRLSPAIRVAQVSSLKTRAATFDAVCAEARELLTQKRRPLAIVALGEDYGRAIVQAAESVGLKVPDDLLVAQETDGLRAQLAKPPITSLDLQAEKTMLAAMSMLVDCIETRKLHPDVVIPVTLSVRASTCPKSQSGALAEGVRFFDHPNLRGRISAVDEAVPAGDEARPLPPEDMKPPPPPPRVARLPKRHAPRRVP